MQEQPSNAPTFILLASVAAEVPGFFLLYAVSYVGFGMTGFIVLLFGCVIFPLVVFAITAAREFSRSIKT